MSLEYYRLQKIHDQEHIYLGGNTAINGPKEMGTSVIRGDTIELSELIDILNERFGTEFKPADQLFLDSIREDAVADDSLRQAAMANSMENFGYRFLSVLENIFIDRMEQNEEMTARFMNEKEFQTTIGRHLLERVYDQIHAEEENLA